MLGADFVGVVECEQAGGIVAEYKVIESWKGPKPGTRMSIRVAVNYWEPQFPIALCGERYYVTAYKETPSRMMSTTFRRRSAALVAGYPRRVRPPPLSQGRKLLPADEEKSPSSNKLPGRPPRPC